MAQVCWADDEKPIGMSSVGVIEKKKLTNAGLYNILIIQESKTHKIST